MNDTQDIYLDPDEERRLRDIDQEETLPPPSRRTLTQSSVEYQPGGLSPVQAEPERIPTPRSFPPVVPAIEPPSPRSFPPVVAAIEPPPPRRVSSGVPGCLTVLALLLALLSLLLNVVLIATLLSVRQIALENVDAALQGLDELGGKGFHYEYEFNREIPIAADVSIK